MRERSIYAANGRRRLGRAGGEVVLIGNKRAASRHKLMLLKAMVFGMRYSYELCPAINMWSMMTMRATCARWPAGRPVGHLFEG